MLGLSDGEDHVILAGLVLSQYQHVTDARMDGNTVAVRVGLLHSVIALQRRGSLLLDHNV